MSRYRNLMVPLLLAATSLSGCAAEKEGEDISEAEAALNAWLRAQYPDGYEPSGAPANVPEEREPNGNAMPVWSSQVIEPTVRNSDITPSAASICIGFGSADNAWCIPADNEDVTIEDGVASLAFTLPPELCEGLSEICHDIVCYEFAETDFGTFTAADVEYLASACGKCDEPSCQQLIGECGAICLDDSDCAEDEACLQGICVGGGALRFSMSWSSSTDFDLHVLTPGGTLLGFQGSRSGDGGEWDYDDTVGGNGAVENIFFDAPLDGTYEYWVNHYSGEGGNFSIVVTAGSDVLANQSGSLSSTGDDSEHYTLSFTQ